MNINIDTKEVSSHGVKIVAIEDDKEVGRAYVYIMTNDLHKEPFAFVEDVFVEEDFRGKGISKPIMEKIKEIAKEKGCYKIIANSRFSNEFVHEYYEKLGYEKTSYSFRMNL